MSSQNPALVRILAPVILVLAPVPVSAEPAEPVASATDPAASGLTELDDQQLLGLFNKRIAENFADHCRIAALLSEMVRRNFTGGVEGFRTEYVLQCAIDRKDWPKAYQEIKQWDALGSDNPPAMEWIFRLAFLAGEHDEALDRLEIMTKLDDPGQLTGLSDKFIFALGRALAKEDKADSVLRQNRMLYQSPHFEMLSAEIRSASALRMLEEQLKKEDVGDVGDMLAHITSPYGYTTMLPDRLYEPIWPQIERHAGPNLAIILGRYLQEKKSIFDLDPDDADKKQDYGHALLFAAHFEELIALAGTIDHGDSAVQNWGEQDGWLLNLEAYAHDALGNTDAADRIFDQFLDIEHRPGENGWVVNFVINRASRLVGQKRWEEGLAAAQVAGEVSNASGSAFANMLVRQSKLCALHGLGRSAEAQVILSEIEENQDDALVVAAEALLCAGERERAATLVIKGLQDEDKRGGMLEALQKPEFELFYSESSLPGIHGELRHHPEVAKLFDELARDVPDAYIPLVGARRLELAAE